MLMALDAMALEDALTRWAGTFLNEPVSIKPTCLHTFALDGKSARGSFDGLEKAVRLLSLMAHESGLTLAQTPVPDGGDDKTKEHKTALRLLEGLVLKGRVITGDAMFCQRDLSKQVIDQQGQFLGFVKENRPTLLHDIETAFASSVEGDFPPRRRQIWKEATDTATSLDKGHGRQERRTLKATTALNAYLDWPGVAQVGQVEREIKQHGKTTREIRFFITSAPRELSNADQLLERTRSHWGIENRSYHMRDVTMGEEASRIRKNAGPQVMAAMRNAAIGFFRATGASNIAQTIRRHTSQVGVLFAKLGIFEL